MSLRINKASFSPEITRLGKLKQTRFAEAYVTNGGNGTRAALATNNTTSYGCANQIAIGNLQNPIVREYINTLIGPIDVTPQDLARTLADELRNGTPAMRLGVGSHHAP